MRDQCGFFLDRLSRYLDGEPDPESAREMEAHLERCPRCRRAYEEMAAGDRLLRESVNAEASDEEREEKAAARLLARLREEPEPQWARGQRSAERAIGSGVWRRFTDRIRPRRLGPTLGWAGGLAAATAAVLLAIRLGMPERPVVTESIRKDKIEQAPVAQDLARESGRSESSRQQTVELPTAAENAPPSAAPSPGSSTPSVEDKDASAAELPAVRARGGRQSEAILQTDEPRPAPPAEDERAKTTAEAEKKDSSKEEDRYAVVPSRAGRASEPTETWGRIRSYADAPVLKSTNDVLETDVVEPTDQEVLSLADTTTGAAGLVERLEKDSAALAAMSDSDLDRAERAHRWRVIGDLWEWLARRDDSPASFERAVQAYERAVDLDPVAGAPDPIRLARARAGAAPNPAEPGNKGPTER
jgi:anti-sigma factor RsiW